MGSPCAQVTFVLTLLLLEAGGNFSDEGRHVLFTATSSLMTFVLLVISDLSDSADGVYAATGKPSGARTCTSLSCPAPLPAVAS